MTLARAGLVTLLALISVASAVAQSAPKAEPVTSRPVVPQKSRQEVEQQPPEQDPPPMQKELLEAATRLHAEAEAEAEALAYIEVVADPSESSVARKQAALAIKEIKGVSSWFVVLRLRVREDDKDVDVRAAVRAALTAIKPPDTPYGLHNIITDNWHLREASPEFVLACATLAKQFPTHPVTVPTLRSVLKKSKDHVSQASRHAAAGALDTLPAKDKAGEKK